MYRSVLRDVALIKYSVPSSVLHHGTCLSPCNRQVESSIRGIYLNGVCSVTVILCTCSLRRFCFLSPTTKVFFFLPSPHYQNVYFSLP